MKPRWVTITAAAACGGEPAVGVDAASDGSQQVTAAELRQRVAGCADMVGGLFASDDGAVANVPVCGFPGALVWTADLDVDCDGKMSAACNSTTDPSYLDQTAATDSNGDPLDAAALPYVVVPGRSARLSYTAAGLAMGSVVVTVFGDRIAYGPLGDVGPTDIIGEASYAMAAELGIDPDPATGGTNGPVIYIAFTGDAAVVGLIEDHQQAVALGDTMARALLASP